MKKVSLGSKVTVKFNDGQKDTYTLVTGADANPVAGLIACTTPFGQAAIGNQEGTRITYLNNRLEPISCEIIEIN